jgi:hypothetical protein
MTYETTVRIRHSCTPTELNEVLARLVQANTADTITVIQAMSVTPKTMMSFYKVRKGPRVWNVAAQSEEDAVKVWTKQMGVFARLKLWYKYGSYMIVRLDSEVIDLTPAGYSQKLTYCDFVQA